MSGKDGLVIVPFAVSMMMMVMMMMKLMTMMTMTMMIMIMMMITLDRCQERMDLWLCHLPCRWSLRKRSHISYHQSEARSQSWSFKMCGACFCSTNIQPIFVAFWDVLRPTVDSKLPNRRIFRPLVNIICPVSDHFNRKVQGQICISNEMKVDLLHFDFMELIFKPQVDLYHFDCMKWNPYTASCQVALSNWIKCNLGIRSQRH